MWTTYIRVTTTSRGRGNALPGAAVKSPSASACRGWRRRAGRGCCTLSPGRSAPLRGSKVSVGAPTSLHLGLAQDRGGLSTPEGQLVPRSGIEPHRLWIEALARSLTHAYWPTFGAGGPRQLARGDVRVRRLTKSYAAAVALMAATSLGACTTSPATDPPPSQSTPGSVASTTTPGTATPMTSATGSSPTTGSGQSQVPEAARANTPQGAEAFTRYFIDQLNEGMSTANPDLLPKLSLATCKSCNSYTSIIQGMRDKSQHFEGQWISPLNFSITDFTVPSASVQTTVSQTGRIVSSNGAVVTTAPSQQGDLVFKLSANDGWRVAEVQVVQS